MPVSALCPHCQGSTSLMEVISSISKTDIYQCENCGKVSEKPKGASDRPLPIQRAGLTEPSFLDKATSSRPSVVLANPAARVP